MWTHNDGMELADGVTGQKLLWRVHDAWMTECGMRVLNLGTVIVGIPHAKVITSDDIALALSKIVPHWDRMFGFQVQNKIRGITPCDYVFAEVALFCDARFNINIEHRPPCDYGTHVVENAATVREKKTLSAVYMSYMGSDVIAKKRILPVFKKRTPHRKMAVASG